MLVNNTIAETPWNPQLKTLKWTCFIICLSVCNKVFRMYRMYSTWTSACDFLASSELSVMNITVFTLVLFTFSYKLFVQATVFKEKDSRKFSSLRQPWNAHSVLLRINILIWSLRNSRMLSIYSLPLYIMLTFASHGAPSSKNEVVTSHGTDAVWLHFLLHCI